MTKKNLSAINRRAWEIRREAAKKWNCGVMEIVWSACFKQAKKEIISNLKLSQEEWMEFFTKKEKSMDYILYKNIILAKNGIATESQELEAETTSAFYQILYRDQEDIKQTALVKIMERLERDGSIEYKYRWSAWSLASLNAAKSYAREIMRNKRSSQNYDYGYNDFSEKIPVVQFAEPNLLRIELQKCLSDRQLKIVSLLQQGYNKTEIADIIGVTRQAVHKNLRKIKAVMLDNGLVAV